MERKVLLIRLRHQTIFINPETIMFLKAAGSYCIAYLNNGSKIKISKNLKAFTTQLSPYIPLEHVHRSYKVNKLYINAVVSSITTNGKLTKKIELTDKSFLPVNKEFMKKVSLQHWEQEHQL